MDVKVYTDAGGWVVSVDGVVRARCQDVYEATRWARGWGW